tara:strand:+ start:184 stop:789 length:606 start_codon:yes stop_codon:yes gene_type:complete
MSGLQKIKSLILISSFLLIPSSCLQRDFNEIKEIPEYKEINPSSYLKRMDFGRHFAHGKTFNWKKTEVPNDIGMVMLDTIYKPVDFFFFKKFNSWFENLLFENGLMSLGGNGENLDCDNYAMLYKSLMGVASYSNGVDVEFAVGLVVVEQRKPFGGIPEGYLHMLNLVFTNKDWYIFEPQTGEYIELYKYPNQKHIKYIIL